MDGDAIGVEAFNRLATPAAERLLAACCAAPEWVRALERGRPYPDRAALLAAADAALAALGEEGLDAALAGHPRIGERVTAGASAREQAGVRGDRIRARLAEANRVYEEKFGHVYLVCAAGRDGEELLAVLQARLGNDPATERQVMRTELGRINRLRLIDRVTG
ncbi:2-oxo-4-hydroxy-4-carboxy-5-ureidoimidazoline decarboxylase [Nocardia thailandica]|uniref:2-oxo-4-hydroxy-4-carboxy-5-ureidoimidazoline decarboxylase n=1 Tax=Nocardia thailandica TaxID=257275 RepID=A0ABW6PT29_9NOCA|nr:2-oxo-4-hydroxy-4-carboxy-5-ureidoimidazoline decarboxylase [Nocardia thailandica]